MIVHSLTILHYGKDYLATALRSTRNLVDRQFLLYSPHPSHGHRIETPPIETRDELMSSIPADLWDKITWIDTNNFYNEGPQRDYALKVASEGASIVLTQDYDEIWDELVLERVLRYVWDHGTARRWLINFSHLWRSFNWVCRDNNWPVRIFDLRQDGNSLGYIPKELGDIHHFGYAISTSVLQYKLAIHGHKDELRPGWFEEKWSAWPPVEDCHPTNGKNDEGVGWWNPEPYDKRLLPHLMRSHQWWDAERIE